MNDRQGNAANNNGNPSEVSDAPAYSDAQMSQIEMKQQSSPPKSVIIDGVTYVMADPSQIQQMQRESQIQKQKQKTEIIYSNNIINNTGVLPAPKSLPRNILSKKHKKRKKKRRNIQTTTNNVITNNNNNNMSSDDSDNKPNGGCVVVVGIVILLLDIGVIAADDNSSYQDVSFGSTSVEYNGGEIDYSDYCDIYGPGGDWCDLETKGMVFIILHLCAWLCEVVALFILSGCCNNTNSSNSDCCGMTLINVGTLSIFLAFICDAIAICVWEINNPIYDIEGPDWGASLWMNLICCIGWLIMIFCVAIKYATT